MIEVSMICLWQTLNGVNAMPLCASDQVSSFPQTQSEFGLAWANEMRASKQVNTARPRLTLRRPVVSRDRHNSTDLPLNHSGFCTGTQFSCTNAGSRKDIFNNHADMFFAPVSAFFVLESTFQPLTSAYTEHCGCSCFSLSCQ